MKIMIFESLYEGICKNSYFIIYQNKNYIPYKLQSNYMRYIYRNSSLRCTLRVTERDEN